MHDIPSLAIAFVPLLGRALLHFFWQGAVIGLVAALWLHALRGSRPQARYAVACCALLACALAPVFDIAWQLANLTDVAISTIDAPAPVAMARIVAGARCRRSSASSAPLNSGSRATPARSL